ncbi:MAG: hypothetical protein AMXMBFR82_41610 [Candidatus Hydrogenedentota bacterium]
MFGLEGKDGRLPVPAHLRLIAFMTDTSPAPSTSPEADARLLSLYIRALVWYLVLVGAFALFGIESIYRNPTPFHALVYPAGETWSGPLFIMGIIGVGVFAFVRFTAPPGTIAPHRVALFAGASFLWVMALVAVLSREDGLAAGNASLWAVLWEGSRWQIPALVVAFTFAMFGHRWYREHPILDDAHGIPCLRSVLTALIAFSILFSAAVAMVRGGMNGVSDAYERETYEYIGDIGLRTTIRIFLRDYNSLHEYLSMHSKVHPPGPVVILWLISKVTFTRSPLVLSWGTIVLGSTAIIPLFLWVRDLFGARQALLSAILYSLVPSIVLFTATSADILFMPLTLWTLFLFWRAIHRNSWKYALGAGALYAVMSLCSFSLLSVGAFFGLVGLWRLGQPGMRLSVIRTAALMIASFLAVHLAVYYWSGFDVIECFRLAKAQFDEDQANLDIYTPRYPAWVFRFLNPMTLFFFAGIPVSVLFCLRILHPRQETPSQEESGVPSRQLFIVFALTLFVLNLLYLGRGEGERSAMYILPFVVIPAAHLLHEHCVRAGSIRPAVVVFVFLAIQSWAIESCLYTYW